MVKAWGEAGFHKEGGCASRILGEKRLNNGKFACQSEPHQPPICPECGEKTKVYRDGWRYPRGNGKPVQRFLCARCGFRFSESATKLIVKRDVLRQFGETPDAMEELAEPRVRNGDLALKEPFNEFAFPGRENVTSHSKSTTIPTVGKGLYSFSSNSGNCRVCVSEGGTKNLAMSGTRHEKPMREGTRLSEDVKGKIVEFLWHLKKQGRADSTITNYKRRLLLMIKAGVDLFNPEDVKEYLAKSSNSNGTKVNDICAYGSFLKFLKISWEPPTYKHEGKIPFIPTEREIDQLIAASGRKVSVVLQLLKETGMRIGEAMKLKWTDMDFERRTVRIVPEKHGNPRIIPVSNRLLEMLSNLPKNSEKIFPNTRKAMDSNFYKQRRKIARKLGNPRLLQISFHTLRHWKGTMEYHKTKDLEYVKRLLGHRRMDSTMLYINIEQAIFQNAPPDEFHVKVAQTAEEIKTLLEAGFEYILQKDGLAFFRKRK